MADTPLAMETLIQRFGGEVCSKITHICFLNKYSFLFYLLQKIKQLLMERKKRWKLHILTIITSILLLILSVQWRNIMETNHP